MGAFEWKWLPRAKILDWYPWQYQNLLTEESDEKETTHQLQPTLVVNSRPSLVTLLIGLAFIVGAAASYMVLNRSSAQSSHYNIHPIFRSDPPKLDYTCGNTTAEAVALGCTFDQLSLSWMPNQCPRDDVDNFLDRLGPDEWKFYYDQKHTAEIDSVETLSMLEDHYYYMRAELHAQHCLYMFTRFFHVIMRGGRVDAIAANLKHWDHCLGLVSGLIKEGTFDRPKTTGVIKMNGC